MNSSTSQLAIACATQAPLSPLGSTRTALRKPAVLAATGWSNSTLYTKIAEGKFPRPSKLDPDGRAVIWWADEIAELQRLAAERQADASAK
jgi:prophage regulatory protein